MSAADGSHTRCFRAAAFSASETSCWLAIPWSALTLDTDNNCFRLAASSQQVRDSPGFDKDSWPSMADRTWATTLHQHYGREPYWSSGGTATDISPTGDIPVGGVGAPEAGSVKL